MGHRLDDARQQISTQGRCGFRNMAPREGSVERLCRIKKTKVKETKETKETARVRRVHVALCTMIEKLTAPTRKCPIDCKVPLWANQYIHPHLSGHSDQYFRNS